MESHEYIDKTVEILKNRFYFAVSKFSVYKRLKNSRNYQYICFDEELRYRNFFHDFGPLNISCLYKYSCKVTKMLQNFRGRKKIVHYTSHDPNKKANAAYLVGCFAVVCMKMEPFEVYKILLITEPYKQFVDALQRTSVHTIRLFDCFSGVAKALQYNLFDFTDFNVQEYDVCDQVEKGNMNWIIPRKFLAFLGPTEPRVGVGHTPGFYLEYFLQHDIKTVIRLNDKLYDSSVFTRIGIEHHDLFFDDGSVPSMDILLSFLRITETAPAAIAVHCKAGLGRTGTLIGAYLVKHYSMTAKEAVAWLRICRPGSVTGAQQAFLEDNEGWLWRSGSEYRIRHYGDETRMPQHKYGIYSKQWPVDRSRIINEARRKLRLNDLNCHYRALRQMDEKQYLRHVSKLLASVRSYEADKLRDKVGKVLTGFPKY
ncbi:dual specificity protein phosphatase CDC14B-like isoform X2 [Tribolium madens]|uniref:dual specificity protein phosphatase CDC14B-like isoform X2 n=1 Tax=Tribolium madens TaxID=41895 RepID=UPI001CF75BC4|nr:dual specificity protein phosphatase CDC14B-like isoform X2 [Tribolium madens]